MVKVWRGAVAFRKHQSGNSRAKAGNPTLTIYPYWFPSLLNFYANRYATSTRVNVERNLGAGPTEGWIESAKADTINKKAISEGCVQDYTDNISLFLHNLQCECRAAV
jgi:hypothetical protein